MYKPGDGGGGRWTAQKRELGKGGRERGKEEERGGLVLRFQFTPREGQNGAGPKEHDRSGRGGTERAIAQGQLCL